MGNGEYGVDTAESVFRAAVSMSGVEYKSMKSVSEIGISESGVKTADIEFKARVSILEWSLSTWRMTLRWVLVSLELGLFDVWREG